MSTVNNSVPATTHPLVHLSPSWGRGQPLRLPLERGNRMARNSGTRKRTTDKTGIVKIFRRSAAGAMIAALVLGFLAAIAPAAFAAGECDSPNYTKIDEPSG